QLKAKYSSHKLKINHNLVSNLKKSSSLEVCPGGEQFLFINSIGDVSPCPWITETASQFVMGNLYQNNLDVLKNKEVYQSFRKKVNNINGSCPAEHNVDELKTVKFSRHSKVYSFTTENLEYLKNI